MFQDQYRRIHSVLHSWTSLWSGSILRDWARMESLIPEPWFDWFRKAGSAERWRQIGAPVDLIEWSKSLSESCRVPRWDEGATLNGESARGMTPKKRHEVESIVSFLRTRKPACSSIVDVGGGAGYLARHLSRECGVPVHSVDLQREVQNSGRRQLARAPWAGNTRVEFHAQRFQEWRLSAMAEAPVFTVGLHTCGALAWEHLEWAVASREVRGALNFGCCYEIMDPARDTQRSRLAQGLPLEWTEDALFLANRAGMERPLEEFEFQQRVQAYRVGLYLWMIEAGFGARAESVGTARDPFYRGPFADYAHDRLFGIRETLPQREELEAFFHRNEERIQRRVFAGRLQNLLARPLELLLLVDRAAWTIEQRPDACVELLEFFDPRVSPRNLGIFMAGVDRNSE